MKEILQLFRRDAEHAPPRPDTALYDIGNKPRILMEASSSASSSREASVMTGERRATPPAQIRPAKPKEDALYGRRW